MTARENACGKDDCWYALHVRSRHEFVARDDLRRRGLETYLPVVSRLRRWKDRKKAVDFPLFPGYIFVQLADGAGSFLPALRTRGAVRLISLVPGEPTAVDPVEFHSLRTMVESGLEVDIYPHLTEGTPVRVARGPLTGAQGVLRSREGDHLFMVNVELLGRSVGVRINGDDIEPC
jgi:transcription antitermination factor NusG